MIYELRVYHCVPGRLPDLLKRFDTITLPLWEKHRIRQAGFWTTMVGVLLAIAPLSAGMIVMWVVQGRLTWPIAFFMISPPGALGMSAFGPDTLSTALRQTPAELRWLSAGVAVGALIHLVLAGWLWNRAKRWFPRMIGRERLQGWAPFTRIPLAQSLQLPLGMRMGAASLLVIL